MAETKTFSQLITAEEITTSDILALSAPFAESDTGYVSRKASLAQVMIEANSSFLYPTELETENKSIFGAINEIKAQSDYIVTTTPSDIIENILEGVNVTQFSAAITPATITICCRLTFELNTFESGATLFRIKPNYLSQGIVHQIVKTNAAVDARLLDKIQIMSSGVVYYGETKGVSNIEVATTYPRKQN